MIGGASVAGGVGILSEDARLLSSLRQSFAVPAGAQAMTFRILSAALEQSDGLPPDAFVVALLDPVTGESLRSEEHTSDLQSLMRSPCAGFCLNKEYEHE